MLRPSDSANFSRTFAALGLIAGPLVLAVSALVDPAWGDDPAAYLTAVAENSGAHIAAGAISTVGTLVFVAGMLGVVRLMRRQRLSLGQVAAGLLTVGLIGLVPTLAVNALDVTIAQSSNREVALALSTAAEESTALNVYWMVFFFGGIVLGSVLLAIALLRRRIVTIFSPILLVLSVVVGFFGDTALLSALSFVVLAAGLGPLAAKIWSAGDDAWRQWELPLEEASGRAPEEPGAPAAGVTTPAH